LAWLANRNYTVEKVPYFVVLLACCVCLLCLFVCMLGGLFCCGIAIAIAIALL
jgi:hypothetical protein